MGVKGRDAGLAASRDAAVGDRAVRVLGPLHLGVVDVDPDCRRHRDRLAIDEDVQMRVDVMDQELLALGLQPGCECPFEGIRRGGPEDGRIHIGRRRLLLGLGCLGRGLAGPAVIVIAAAGNRQDKDCDPDRERQGECFSHAGAPL
jgi:hypothetical protein